MKDKSKSAWQLLEDLFQTHFPNVRERLETITHRIFSDEKARLQYAEKYLGTVFDAFKVNARFHFENSAPIIEERMGNVWVKLKLVRRFLNKLLEKKLFALDKLTDPKTSLIFKIIYFLMYAGLIFAGGLVFSRAFPYVFPEQDLTSGIAMAVIIPIPSFCAAYLVKHFGYLSRERIRSIILLIAGISGLLMFLFIGIARRFADGGLDAAALANAVLGPDQGFNWDELIFRTAAFLAFSLSLVAEVGASASLAILLHAETEKHVDTDTIEEELTTAGKNEKDMEEQLIELRAEARQHRLEDELLVKWCDAKKEDLIIDFLSELGAKDAQLNHDFDSLPLSEKQKLMLGNGKGNGNHPKH